MTKLHDLYTQQGQSVWIDYIRRQFILDGGLQAAVDEGVRGVTSNPAIFEKAIAHSDDYDEQIQALVAEGKSVEEIMRNSDLALYRAKDEGGGEHKHRNGCKRGEVEDEAVSAQIEQPSAEEHHRNRKHPARSNDKADPAGTAACGISLCHDDIEHRDHHAHQTDGEAFQCDHGVDLECGGDG